MTKLHPFPPVFRHICQLSADKGILFYSTADFLVFYTFISVKCLREGIVAIAFTIMFNHFHMEALFASDRKMSSLMNGATSSFAKAYNKHYGLSGRVFTKSFNRSVKKGEKNVRNTVIYIGNNGKEKTPGIRAEDYKWSFLKYLVSDHPFSEAIDFQDASEELMNFMAAVLRQRGKMRSLGYNFFESVEYNTLTDKEKKQLTDFIIVTYFFLDKKKLFELYGDFDSLCTAMNAVSGAEHEISDDKSGEDYRHYYRMIKICLGKGVDVTKHRFSVSGIGYDQERKRLIRKDQAISPSSFEKNRKDGAILLSSFRLKELITSFRVEMNVSDYEIAKFFHLL